MRKRDAMRLKSRYVGVTFGALIGTVVLIYPVVFGSPQSPAQMTAAAATEPPVRLTALGPTPPASSATPSNAVTGSELVSGRWEPWWGDAAIWTIGDGRAAGAFESVNPTGKANAIIRLGSPSTKFVQRIDVSLRATGATSLFVLQFDQDWSSLPTIELLPVRGAASQWTRATRSVSLHPQTRHASLAVVGSVDRFDVDGLRFQATTVPVSAPTLPAAKTGPWALRWNDEFDGRTLGPSWMADHATLAYANELQCYTPSSDNVDVVGGMLVVRAQRAQVRCPTDSGTVERQYTSGRVSTRGRFSFREGRVEIRAKLPVGAGMWPALWLLPNDEGRHPFGRNGEIDIAEAVGRTPSSVFATLHFNYEAGAGGRIGGSLDTREPLDRSFHVFAVEWDTGEVRWFLDDQLYFRAGKNTVMWPAPPGAALPAPFDQPFYLIMNLAVGGTWPGDPDDTTVFPAVMQVDYVRVFQRKG